MKRINLVALVALLLSASTQSQAETADEFGLLNLDDKSLAAEAGKLNRVLTAQK